MNEQVFWKVIEKSSLESDDVNKRFLWIEGQLCQLTEREIFKFDKVLYFLLEKSNTEDIWAASFVLIEGRNEEQFTAFKYWLMLQGQRIFKKAINDAESLAVFTDFFKNKIPNLSKLTEFKILAAKSYSKKTGLDNYQEIFPYQLKCPSIESFLNTDETTIMDLVPLLCKGMGWENDFVQGTWKRDENPF